ncbi:MAG: redoxin family protein [Verrucomicrobiota bacterium]|nr:redoxin family protein [Verrucomicrobiota bacterium]
MRSGQKLIMGLCLGLIAMAVGPLHGATLKVGDKAPKITIEKWVKGEPVTAFKPGNVYVVEFWATWCPPCRTSIPHLTELQKRFKEKKVTIIGVTSENGGLAEIEPFVTDMGDKMAYTVAFDSERKTSQAWMEAAGQNGIPTAFVVEQTGRVAWIGHPMNHLDAVLEEVTSGDYDMDAAVAKAKQAAEIEAKAEPIQQRLQAAAGAGDTEAILAAVDELVDLDVEQFGQMAFIKFQILVRENEDYKGAYAYVKDIAPRKLSKNPELLNGFAWSIMDAPWIEERDLPLALDLAKMANDSSGGKDPSVLDTLARAHFENGDKAKALEVQTQAVELAPEGEMRDALQERLVQYKGE